MLKSSTVTIACVLCIGSAPERYLPPALAAIADAVDVLAVNDNSRLARSVNREAVEASALGARGALTLAAHPFVDFADMRNRAFAQLRVLEPPPAWVVFLDADEVHGKQITFITRHILPHLDRGVGQVDTYTYNFFGTYGWITDVARRLVFFRYNPHIRWLNSVHEKAVGIAGRRLVLPYTYHHYGNVVSPEALARKHHRYFVLGNPVPRPPDPAEATAEIYLAKADGVRPYRGPHPAAARTTLARLEAEFASELSMIDAGFKARRGLLSRTRGALQSVNETLRVELRRVEHPLVYRLPSRAM